MKRIRFIAIFALLIGFALSCEVEPPIPPCERDHVGTVTVKNATPWSLWVDVTWGNVAENYEKLLYAGNSYKYNNVPAAGHPESNGGTIEVWNSVDGSQWYYEFRNLVPCEDMLFEWVPLTLKSANGCPFALVLPNGDHVIPKLKIKQ